MSSCLPTGRQLSERTAAPTTGTSTPTRRVGQYLRWSRPKAQSPLIMQLGSQQVVVVPAAAAHVSSQNCVKVDRWSSSSHSDSAHKRLLAMVRGHLIGLGSMSAAQVSAENPRFSASAIPPWMNWSSYELHARLSRFGSHCHRKPIQGEISRSAGKIPGGQGSPGQGQQLRRQAIPRQLQNGCTTSKGRSVQVGTLSRSHESTWCRRFRPTYPRDPKPWISARGRTKDGA